MRNRFPGVCYRCGKRVRTGEGHFERCKAGEVPLQPKARWRVQHASCAITYRYTDHHYLKRRDEEETQRC